MTGFIMKLSEEQTNILKGAFERFPNPDYHSEALRMVSDKTGLQEGVIKAWFENRRESLCKNMKTSDEDVQILDGRSINSEVSDDNLDFVELDEAPEGSPPLLVQNQSANGNSYNTLSKEDKAEEYDNLKLQMENLKKQMLLMSHSLDQRDQQLQPPVQPRPQVRHHQPHQQHFLPYPAQDYHHGYHYPPSFPYNPYSPWNLPYPPPEFQIVFLNPPFPRIDIIARKDHPEPTADTASKEAVTISPNVSTFAVEETTESKDIEKKCVEDDESYKGQDCEKDIVLEDEEPLFEKIPKMGRDLVDIVDNFEKKVLVEIEKDNIKIDATPLKKRTYNDLDKPESVKKKYRLPPTPYKINRDEKQNEVVEILLKLSDGNTINVLGKKAKKASKDMDFTKQISNKESTALKSIFLFIIF